MAIFLAFGLAGCALSAGNSQTAPVSSSPAASSARAAEAPSEMPTSGDSPSPPPAASYAPSPASEAPQNASATPGVPAPEKTSAPLGLLPAYFLAAKPDDAAPKDAKGVVLASYGGGLGQQYNPTTIAQIALAYYGRWLSDTDPDKAAADRKSFLAQTDWLIAHQSADGRWLYSFEWGSQQVPWWSAIAEGQGMSALLRAYAMTGDPAALAAVIRARGTFDRDLGDDGIAAPVTVGGTTYIVYQEYLPGYEPNVLNGWIFSLIGLYETETYLGDSGAYEDLWSSDRGFVALKALLPYYDTGAWSRYYVERFGKSPSGGLDTTAYHILVIAQLRYLATISGDAFFSDCAARFASYMKT